MKCTKYSIMRLFCLVEWSLLPIWSLIINQQSRLIVFNPIMKSSLDEWNVLQTNQEINSLSLHFHNSRNRQNIYGLKRTSLYFYSSKGWFYKVFPVIQIIFHSRQSVKDRQMLKVAQPKNWLRLRVVSKPVRHYQHC